MVPRLGEPGQTAPHEAVHGRHHDHHSGRRGEQQGEVRIHAASRDEGAQSLQEARAAGELGVPATMEAFQAPAQAVIIRLRDGKDAGDDHGPPRSSPRTRSRSDVSA